MQKNGNSSPIRVVVDAMGGDYGPQEPIKGALEALESVSLPTWARSEAEALVEFLAQRQY